MITTNLKIKVLSNKRSYDKTYVDNYLKAREKYCIQNKNHFQNIFEKYKINLSGKIVLDLAAGPGVDLKVLNDFNPQQLIWLDKMPDCYTTAKKYLNKLKNVTFYIKDLMDLECFKNENVDFIICRDSLFYIGNDYLFFKNIKRILKKEGVFYGRNQTFNYYNEQFRKNDGLIKRLRHVFFDWPLYKKTGLRIFSFMPVDPKRLINIFKKLNLKIVMFEVKNGSIEFIIKKVIL